MNKEKAEELLKDYIEPDGALSGYTPYIWWEPGDQIVTLGCDQPDEDIFEIDLLEAIVWWIHNTPTPPLVNTLGCRPDADDDSGHSNPEEAKCQTARPAK
jgi:hypothetical protein